MEEEAKITRSGKTQKIKDPRRVEAGKKLAAISKEAKEKKARERLSVAMTEQTPDETLSAFIYIAIIATLGGLCYGYYKYSTKTTNAKPKNEHKEGQPQPQRTAPQLESFDN